MKRTLLLGLGIMLAVAAVADDMIVMSNGDIIKAKVQEITPTEIKYKKASNPDGPTYTVNKSDVLAINYENGEKDTFGPAMTAANQTQQEAANDPNQPVFVAPVPSANNAELIQYWNSGTPRHKKNKPDEKKRDDTNFFMQVFGITPNSIMSDGNITVSFVLNDEYNGLSEGKFDKNFKRDWVDFYDTYRIVINNVSDKTVYVDVMNSFRIYPNGESESFYNNMSVTHSSSAGGGVGLGLGAVASALGVGGVVGNLASGVSVGGGSSHGTSVTENENVILTIPPHGRVEMPAKIYTNSKKNKTTKNYEMFRFVNSFKPNTQKPDKWRYEERGDLYEGQTQEYRITYSTQRNFATYTTLNIGVCVRGIIGVGGTTTVADIVVEDGPEFFSSMMYNKFSNKGGAADASNGGPLNRRH